MVGISVFAALIKSKGESEACLVVAELSGIRRKSIGAFFLFFFFFYKSSSEVVCTSWYFQGPWQQLSSKIRDTADQELVCAVACGMLCMTVKETRTLRNCRPKKSKPCKGSSVK